MRQPETVGRRAFAAGLLLFAGVAAARQVVDLRIGNHEVARLDASALARLPQRHVRASAHGETATWSGVSLGDVLSHYGVVRGEALRGKALAGTVRVIASDGYAVVFSLGELDPTLGHTRVLLVDHRDGRPLGNKLGPWRLVVPDDSRPARWVRNVAAIEVEGPVTGPLP